MAQEFKLKDLTTLSDLKNTDKKEAEVEGIEGGKVLIVKVQDQVHALNANCTHYGAPLKNGVVTKEGRLTCPWHGACFNVKTGDVEDSPAPDHLNKFDVFERDGAVYIKGAEADVKSGRRKPVFKVKSSGQEKVVIVGGYVIALVLIWIMTNKKSVVQAHLVPFSNSANTASTAASLSLPTRVPPLTAPNSPKLSSPIRPKLSYETNSGTRTQTLVLPMTLSHL